LRQYIGTMTNDMATGMSRNRLYPEIQPHTQGRLSVAPPHQLYWEECGNPAGAPVLFLHGGPGAGISGSGRRFFDPAHYRIVLFDQRGAGQSTPHAELADNTTEALIADIEALRESRGIDKWVVFGGSWGALLAIAYAQAHPDRCRGLILRGVFLGSSGEIDWFVNGMGRFFPEAWRAFAGHLPASERGDILASYYRRLVHPDPAVHMPAALAWRRYETACSALIPPGHAAAEEDPQAALALARIEAHYFVNACFLHDGALLAGARRMAAVPGVIVQGRYDMVCPPHVADQLAGAWPKARYEIIPDAGHSAMEPGITAALVAATERFKQLP
jgi:proline iminopeptidase